MGLPEDGPPGHSQETSRFHMYLKVQRGSIDVSYSHVGMDGYLVVRQSQLGVTSM